MDTTFPDVPFSCCTAQGTSGMIELQLRHVTKSYFLIVRLEEKEDETNLEYKVNKRSCTIQGHYYETVATRK